MGEPARVIVHAEPLTLNREDALEFTGLAPKMFDQMEAAGRIKGKCLGRKGEKIYRTAELREVVDLLFGKGAANDVDGEFEGLGGA